MPFDGGGPAMVEVGLALGLGREVVMQGRLKGCRLRGRGEKGHGVAPCQGSDLLQAQAGPGGHHT